jgi:alkylation response protein AidB-like acyl-CoA dehydrogenase
MIKGQKIFISAGNSDVVDNVIHLLIAKLKDGPLGVSGISLFVVPEKVSMPAPRWKITMFNAVDRA